MRMQDRIEEKLNSTLTATLIAVENQSHLHHGHAGDDGSGQSHFKVQIVSDAFLSLSRVQRHRLVYELLEAELAGGIHALELDLKTIEEHEKAA